MWQQGRNILERWLFAPFTGRVAANRARRLVQYPYALLRDLLGGQLNLHAMGLVYATLLALVPLVAFSFAILKVFGAHRDLEPLIYEFFRPMGGAAGALTQKVMDFEGFQINDELLTRAKPDAVVMHCLPAHRGQEITADVLDGPKSIAWKQADYKFHGAQGILASLLA